MSKSRAGRQSAVRDALAHMRQTGLCGAGRPVRAASTVEAFDAADISDRQFCILALQFR
jgi:hypothetical protein